MRKKEDEEIIALCRQVVEYVSAQGCLPANVHTANMRIGRGDELPEAEKGLGMYDYDTRCW